MPNNVHDVSLAILAGPADAPFLAQMVRHIVSENRFPFSRRTLVIDTLPNRLSANPGSVEKLTAIAEQLRAAGLIDRVFGLAVARSVQDEWSRKHFGRKLRWDRDYRGVPLFGWLAGLEDCESEYHVHFDSDILLHQSGDYSWIDHGIDMLRADPGVLCMMPLPGPPRLDGTIYQGGAFTEDPQGFYRFPSFSSRRFLVSRKKYESLLPLGAVCASTRHWLKSFFTQASPVQNWETLVGLRMQQLGLSRAALKDSRAWTLHAPDHGVKFQTRIGSIIAEVECGRFPADQAGHYDLRLQDWTAEQSPSLDT